MPTLSNQNQQNITDSSLAYLYLTASNHFDKFASPNTYLTTLPNATTPAVLRLTKVSDCANNIIDILPTASTYTAATNSERKGVQVKKKYKPVALKVKPVTSSISENFKIEHCIVGDPLANMLTLSSNLSPFKPTGCFTEEHRQQFVSNYDIGFLTTSKLNILTDLMSKQNQAFA
ncbi:hypothetical protein C0992_010716 [Termitomyces sp. T32_za158]|nr:hypothetical protein C0992_010716 [Termitomyces sp. T32_za158]